MKKENGVTITSLIIYVGMMLVVVLLVAKATGFIYNNSDNIENSSQEADYNKLNLYMISQTKEEDVKCKIGSMNLNSDNEYAFTDSESISGSAIQFISDEEHVIGKVGNGIYFDKVKICHNVELFTITKESNNSNKITVSIKFENNDKIFTTDYNLKESINN